MLVRTVVFVYSGSVVLFGCLVVFVGLMAGVLHFGIRGSR